MLHIPRPLPANALLLFILLLPVPLLTVPNASAETYAELLAFLDQHPRLEALTREANAHERLADAALGLPDPVVSLGVNNLPIENPAFDRYLPTNKAIGLTQRIPSRAGRKALAATENATAELLVHQAAAIRAELEAELIALLHKQRALRQEQQLTVRQARHYQLLKDTVSADVSGGQALVYRLSELDVEAAEVALKRAELAADLDQTESELLALLGRLPETQPPAIAIRTWNGEPRQLHAVRIAQAAEAAATGAQRRAATRWRPEWGLSLAYQQREPGQDFDGDDWISAQVSFTLPLWAGRNQRPTLAAATERREAARADVAAVTRAATVELKTLKAQHLRAVTSERTLREQLKAVQQTVRAQRTLYESGGNSYGPVLDGEITTFRLEAGAVRQAAIAAAAAARFNAKLVNQ